MNQTRVLDIMGIKFPLTLRSIEETPTTKADFVALVVLPGSPALKVGMWRNDMWCNERRKPYDPQPVRWYSIGGSNEPTA